MRSWVLTFFACIAVAITSLNFGDTTQVAQAMMSPRCEETGANCKVGDQGPLGGTVYYDAGSPQWWGQFIEFSNRYETSVGWPLGTGKTYDTSTERVLSKSLGMGRENSLRTNYFGMNYKLQVDMGWSVPSKDELDALFASIYLPKLYAGPLWTSSEASETFAWYQDFRDGTQFTDANGIIRLLKGNKDLSRSFKHTGSDFASKEIRLQFTHSFGPKNPAVGRSQVLGATRSKWSCAQSGLDCAVGDIGPGGGIVFYDAGKQNTWGRYLEVAPRSCEGERIAFREESFYYPAPIYFSSTANRERKIAKLVGMGQINTTRIVSAFGSRYKNYAAKFADDSLCNGLSDWFLPSKDELDLVFNTVAQNRVGGSDTPLGSFNKGFYWTSTDYNGNTAWAQYFMDGQQFDRVQTMSGNKTPPTPFRVRAIRVVVPTGG